LNDPDLDTIIATNHNVGNFKKGFTGPNAVSAVSNSPFYKLDLIATQGTQGITNISAGSTINSTGLVAFAGRTAAGYAFYVGTQE
jgi:hypothetical protein